MKHTLLSAAFATMLAVPALANDYMIMAPAAPGGGWDGTARAMQEVMQAEGISASVQVQNVPGAGGTVGLAQFASSTSGDASQLIVGGYVMVGAILTNESPVSLADVTPIARLTGEAVGIAVSASSPIQNINELVEMMKADPGAVSWAGGSAGSSLATAGVSGAHLNPAVSIALSIFADFEKRKLPFYILAQVAGAFCGALLVYTLYSNLFFDFEQTHHMIRGSQASLELASVFSTFPNPVLSTGQAFLVEVIITAILMGVIMSLTDDAELAKRCIEIYAADKVGSSFYNLWHGEVYHHRRKRVAFISGDFRTHPVGYLLIGMIEGLDKRRFEITGVSTSATDGSDLWKRYRCAFDHYLDVQGKPSLEIARLLRAMEIDIAIDLSGYTEGSRLDVLAHRPAPVQMTYLGFPGTLALPFINYLIADPRIIPKKPISARMKAPMMLVVLQIGF